MNTLTAAMPSVIMYTHVRTRSFLIFLLLGSMLTVTQAFAQNDSQELSGEERAILSMLQDRDRAIKSILRRSETITNEQKEDLRSLINDVIDFRAMGKEALGRHWNKLTDVQKDHFVDTFGQIVRLQSLADTEVYRSVVAYDGVSVTGDEAQVLTTTTFKEIPTPVEYSLIKTEAGWKASDIILDEVSTVRGYARSFQSVIRKKGFDELMERLEKRLEKEKSEQAGLG